MSPPALEMTLAVKQQNKNSMIRHKSSNGTNISRHQNRQLSQA